jgi:phosphoserine phosphatase RsbU/P
MSFAQKYRTWLADLKKGLQRADWLLAGGAALSVIVLMMLAPWLTDRYRAPLQERMPDSELIARAEAWLMHHPLPHTDYFSGFSIHSRTQEYNALIREYGAEAVDQACQRQPENVIPSIHAQILFTPTDAGQRSIPALFRDFRDGFRDGFNDSESDSVATAVRNITNTSLIDIRYSLILSMRGELIRFERQGRQRFEPVGFHEEALQAGFGLPLTGLTDPAQLRFAPGIGESEVLDDVAPGTNTSDPTTTRSNTTTEPPHIISASKLWRIADYHLSTTRWEPDYFSRDGISVRRENNLQIATIKLVSNEQLFGRLTHLEIDIDQTGHLHRIEPSYTVINGSPEPGVNIREGTAMGVIVVLSIAILLLLFRRTLKRLIDTKLSRPEAWVGSIAAMVYFISGYFSRTIELGYWSMSGGDIAGLVFGSLIMALGGWLFVLMLSAYGSSVSQEVWPTRLRELNLIRKGLWINQPVGTALLRGVLAACILSALAVVLVWLLPVKGLRLAEGAVFLSHRSYAGSLFVLGGYVTSTFIFLFVVLMGLAAHVWRLTRNQWLSGAIIAIFWTLLHISPLDVLPTQWDLVLSFFSGLLIAFVFWNFGMLTAAFTALFHIIILNAAAGLAVAFSPDTIQWLLLLAMPATALAVGVAGVVSGRTMLMIPEVIPGYLIEMANRERMEREFEISRHVQQRFLPLSTPQVEGYEMMAACHPASEVGGDYYEFLPANDGRLALAIGDVSGKGFKAAFYMTLIKGFTQSLAEQEQDPARFLSRVNSLFYRNAERGTFVSMIFGYLDLKQRELHFARAGHNPAVWYHAATGKAELVKAGGMALGLVNDQRFETSLVVQKALLEPGDIIVLYTDGYTEAMNPAGELYGEERFSGVIERHAGLSLNEMVTMLNDDVDRFTGGHQQSDDMTILAIKVNEG